MSSAPNWPYDTGNIQLLGCRIFVRKGMMPTRPGIIQPFKLLVLQIAKP